MVTHHVLFEFMGFLSLAVIGPLWRCDVIMNDVGENYKCNFHISGWFLVGFVVLTHHKPNQKSSRNVKITFVIFYV